MQSTSSKTQAIFAAGVTFYLGMALALLLLLTANTSPMWAQEGDAGYALSFDGVNDFVELAETTAVMGSGWRETKTVSLWVRPTGLAEACRDPAWCDAIFGDRPRWWGISRGVIAGRDRIWVWNYDGSYDSVEIEYTAGAWVHVTLVHSGGVLRAYRNGVEVGHVPSGATQQPSTGAQPVLHLAGVINNAERNWTFAGELDEVRIWDRAQSAAAVSRDMYRTLSGTEAGLVAYYQMSNGAGTVLTDDSVHAWDGILHDGGQGVPPNGRPAIWVVSTAFDGATTATPSGTATPVGTATRPRRTPTPTSTSTPRPDGTSPRLWLPSILKPQRNGASSSRPLQSSRVSIKKPVDISLVRR